MPDTSLRDMQVQSFPDPALLAQELAAQIAAQLRRDLDRRDMVRFGVSGGRTPTLLYEALSGIEIDWHRVDITLVDDRCVSAEHPASNFGLIQRIFDQNFSQSAKITGLWDHHQTSAENERAMQAVLSQGDVFNSIAILGMGIDGHIASLFPQADGIVAAMDLKSAARVKSIEAQKSAVTGDITHRITMTLPMLMSFEKLILLIQGQDKIEALEAALRTGPATETLPVSALCAHRPDLAIVHAVR